MNSRIRFGFLGTLFLLIASLTHPSARGDSTRSLTTKEIPAALQPFVENHSLAGAVVLVADKDQILSLDTVGFADLAGKKPMTADAMFWVASQSKPITGAALMILVDEGKVQLDDPVSKYLPEFKEMKIAVGKGKEAELVPAKQPITIRQILSHTSGMPFSTSIEAPTLDKGTLAERVKNYASTPLNSEPGTKYAYSNAGINTAGRIIEVVSGSSFEDFVEKRIFIPLGMKDTTFWPNEAQLTRLAKAYRPNKGKDDLEETKIAQLQYPLSDRKRQSMPAGGYFSTATDMARFCQMVLNGGTFKGKKILSEEAVKTMTSKQTGAALKDNYGLGWATGGNIGHGGAYSTNMAIDTKKGLIFIWMVQHAGYPGDGSKSQGEFRKAAEKLFDKK